MTKKFYLLITLLLTTLSLCAQTSVFTFSPKADTTKVDGNKISGEKCTVGLFGSASVSSSNVATLNYGSFIRVRGDNRSINKITITGVTKNDAELKCNVGNGTVTDDGNGTITWTPSVNSGTVILNMAGPIGSYISFNKITVDYSSNGSNMTEPILDISGDKNYDYNLKEEINDENVDEPAVTIFPSYTSTTEITSNFHISYFIAGQSFDKEATTYTTDPVTGSTIGRNGNIIIGDNAGSFRVLAFVTPRNEFANKYDASCAFYTVTVDTAKASITITPNETQTIKGYIKNYTEYGTSKILNINVPFPAFKATYNNSKYKNLDATAFYDCTASLPVSGNSQYMTIDNTKKLFTPIKATSGSFGKRATFDIKLTFTPVKTEKRDYTKSFKTITKTIHMSVDELTGTKKIKIHLEFPSDTLNWYCNSTTGSDNISAYTYSNLKPLKPKVIDEYGNVIPESEYTDGYHNPLTGTWGVVPYSMTVDSIHKNGCFRIGKAVSTFNGSWTYLKTGALDAVNNTWCTEFDWSKGLTPHNKVQDSYDTVTVTIFPNNCHALYESATGGYVIHNMQRVPRIDVTPNPRNVYVTKDTEYDFKKDFITQAYFDDKFLNQTQTLNNQFYIFSFVRGDGVVITDYDYGRAKYPDFDAKYWEKYAKQTFPQRGVKDVDFWKKYNDDDHWINKYVKKSKDGDASKDTLWYIFDRSWSGNTENDWKFKFTKEGSCPIDFRCVTWAYPSYTVTYNSQNHYVFVVSDSVKPRMEIDPDTIVIKKTSTKFDEPVITMWNTLNQDVSSRYGITFKLPDSEATVDTTSTGKNHGVILSADKKHVSLAPFFYHEKTGNRTDSPKLRAGDVKIQIIAKAINANADGTKIDSTRYLSDSTHYYVLRIVDDNYEYKVIGYNDPVLRGQDVSDTLSTTGLYHTYYGKMAFIYPGDSHTPGRLTPRTIFHAVTGCSIQLGANCDGDLKYWTFTDDLGHDHGDNSTEKPNCIDSVDKHRLHPIVSGGVAGPEKNIRNGILPINGTFYVFVPSTNGFLSFDGVWEKNNTYSVIEVTKDSVISTLETFTPTEDLHGTHDFEHALIQGNTYYLYNTYKGVNDDPLPMYGYNFTPAFVNSHYDKERVKKGVAYTNGFTGSLPELVENVNRTATDYSLVDFDVKQETGFKVRSGYSKEATDYATIDSKSGGIEVEKGTANISNNTVPDANECIKICASVQSRDSLARGIKKYPFYYLTINDDVPFYMHEETGITPEVCKKVTTTNFRTYVDMTYGGWKWTDAAAGEGHTNYKFYRQYDSKTGKKDSTILTDAWQETLLDSVGKDNLTLDNFNFVSQGKQNPYDDQCQSFNAGRGINSVLCGEGDKGENTSLNMPCKGTFIRFEPHEKGTLAVYLIQNGIFSYSIDPLYKNGKPMTHEETSDARMSGRPLNIIDEKGNPVTLAQWNGTTSKGFGGYTESHYLFTFNDPTFQKNFNSTVPYTKDGLTTADYNKTALNGCYVANYNEKTKTFSNSGTLLRDYIQSTLKDKIIHDTPQSVIATCDSAGNNTGYYTISKGYVRYAFEVLPGKTYYIFANGSKIAPCGFAFMPDDNDDPASNWLNRPITATHPETSYPEQLAGVKEVYIDVNKSLEDNIKDNTNFFNVRANVTLHGRKFSKNHWTSLCLPFSVEESQVNRIFGEDAIILTFDSVGQAKGYNIAHFTNHVTHILEAGMPYFIKPSIDPVGYSTRYNDMVFKDVYIEGTTDDKYAVTPYTKVGSYEHAKTNTYIYDGATGKGLKSYSLESRGTLDDVSTNMSPYSYFMYNDSLYYITAKRTNKTPARYWAYLYNTDNTPNLAKSTMLYGTLFPVDDNHNSTTGVGGVIIEDEKPTYDSPMDNNVYDVSGKMVREDTTNVTGLPAGIYIVNGRKVIIK